MYIYAKIYVLGNFMKERQSRLKAIKNLIKNNRIESQDDLLSLLLKEGFDVTQATLSRDLKLLKVGKVPASIWTPKTRNPSVRNTRS